MYIVSQPTKANRNSAPPPVQSIPGGVGGLSRICCSENVPLDRWTGHIDRSTDRRMDRWIDRQNIAVFFDAYSAARFGQDVPSPMAYIRLELELFSFLLLLVACCLLLVACCLLLVACCLLLVACLVENVYNHLSLFHLALTGFGSRCSHAAFCSSCLSLACIRSTCSVLLRV